MDLPAVTYTPGISPRSARPKANEAVYRTPQDRERDVVRGLVLFEAGYYWEAHEQWEQVWMDLGRTGPVADLLKGLIKLAAAGVRFRTGTPDGARRHARRARELFETVQHQPAALELWGAFETRCSLSGLIDLAGQIADGGAHPEVCPHERPVVFWGWPMLTEEQS